MSRIVSLFILLLTSNVCFAQEAQDTIILQNGKKIVGRVLSVNDTLTNNAIIKPEKKRLIYQFGIGLSVPLRDYGTNYSSTTQLEPSEERIEAEVGGHLDAGVMYYTSPGFALTARLGTDLNSTNNHLNFFISQCLLGIYLPLNAPGQGTQFYITALSGVISGYSPPSDFILSTGPTTYTYVRDSYSPGFFVPYYMGFGFKFKTGKKNACSITLSYLGGRMGYQSIHETDFYYYTNNTLISKDITTYYAFSKMGIIQLTLGFSLNDKI